MSFYAMSLQGTTPFGSFVSGTIADFLGAPWTMVVMGLCVVAGTMLLRNKVDEDRETKTAPVTPDKERW